MADKDNAELAVAAGPRHLPVVVAVLTDVALVALISGWVVTRSWGWAALSAIALASVLAHQRVALRRRRGAKSRGESPSRWSMATFIVTDLVADLVLPVVAVINWDPPWHGYAGALLLAMNGGIIVLSLVQAIREIRLERS